MLSCEIKVLMQQMVGMLSEMEQKLLELIMVKLREYIESKKLIENLKIVMQQKMGDVGRESQKADNTD